MMSEKYHVIHMCKQCVPGSLSRPYTEPGFEASSKVSVIQTIHINRLTIIVIYNDLYGVLASLECPISGCNYDRFLIFHNAVIIDGEGGTCLSGWLPWSSCLGTSREFNHSTYIIKIQS